MTSNAPSSSVILLNDLSDVVCISGNEAVMLLMLLAIDSPSTLTKLSLLCWVAVGSLTDLVPV